MMIQQPSCIQKNTKLQGDICFCCSESKMGTNHYFAKCEHNGICRKCGQKQLVKCLGEKTVPECLFGCGAELNIEEDSLFQFFSNSSHEMWKKKANEMKKCKENKNNKVLKSCSQLDCKGFVVRNRCMICEANYCSHCRELDHDPTIKCKLKKTSPFQNIKACPSCHIFFIKESGCLSIKCSNCLLRFCGECLQDWDKSHHFKHGPKGFFEGLKGFFQQKICCCSFRRKDSTPNKKDREKSYRQNNISAQKINYMQNRQQISNSMP